MYKKVKQEWELLRQEKRKSLPIILLHVLRAKNKQICTRKPCLPIPFFSWRLIHSLGNSQANPKEGSNQDRNCCDTLDRRRESLPF